MTLRAWDLYARSKKPRRLTNAAGERTWFNWTQHPDHGPGAELLDPQPATSVLDLGCGKGGNAAHLATLGVRVTGVDWSRPQIDAAGERWRDVPGLHFVAADVVDYLRTSAVGWDAMYSVFGVVWFHDPAILLPLIRRRLRPGGQLCFRTCRRSMTATACGPRVGRRSCRRLAGWGGRAGNAARARTQAGVLGRDPRELAHPR